jgi:transmembrane sensor
MEKRLDQMVSVASKKFKKGPFLIKTDLSDAYVLTMILLLALAWCSAFKGSKKPGKYLPPGKCAGTMLEEYPKSIFNAELILSDGRKISLLNIKDGVIGNQGIYRIEKMGDAIYYKRNGNEFVGNGGYHIIRTPNGGRCRVIFPGGNTVDLDVASALQFDVSSFDMAHKITVIGQALFDIKNCEGIPFEVLIPSADKRSSTAELEVIDSRFHVSAFQDEYIRRITLLNGNLKVSALPVRPLNPDIPTKGKTTIKTLNNCGDQAQLMIETKINIVHNIDTAEETGWTECSVHFKRRPTKQVLRTLERWYDVTVAYNTLQVPLFLYTGRVNRETSLETVLEIMQFQCDELHLSYDSVARVITVLP